MEIDTHPGAARARLGRPARTLVPRAIAAAAEVSSSVRSAWPPAVGARPRRSEAPCSRACERGAAPRPPRPARGCWSCALTFSDLRHASASPVARRRRLPRIRTARGFSLMTEGLVARAGRVPEAHPGIRPPPEGSPALEVTVMRLPPREAADLSSDERCVCPLCVQGFQAYLDLAAAASEVRIKHMPFLGCSSPHLHFCVARSMLSRGRPPSALQSGLRLGWPAEADSTIVG